MAKNVTLTTIAAAALLLAPAAAATWSSYGAYEPDTPWDVRSLMWHDAPGTVTNRVYFNAFVQYVDGGPNGGVINPNVGMLKTRFDPVGERAFEAVLGVWTDCNQDGYIGMAESAVREYKSEVLEATFGSSICPPSAGHAIGAAWDGSNNYNGWVSELIPIGNKETKKADKRVWKDDEAMVWGDPGQPNDAAAQVERGCSTFPGRGHGHNVGGILFAADCEGRRTVQGQPASVLDTFDLVGGPAGLGWGEDPESSGSPLNVEFGSDESQHSAVYVQDCDAEPILTTGKDLPGDDQDDVVLLRPAPANPIGDPGSATVPGTLNYTQESIGVLPDDTDGRGNVSTSNCDFEDDSGNDFYSNIESNPAASQVDGKNRATWNFAFNTATRGSLPVNFIPSGAGAAGIPTDLGVEATTAGCTHSGCMQSFWVGTGTAIYTPPVTRSTTDPTIADAPHYSFYAFVGAATLDRGFVTPGGSGTYGAAQCGANEDGEHNGWNCNSAEWYLLEDGTPQVETRPLARVGDTYLFRDVDCYDGGAGDLGVGISPAFYGEKPCPIV